MSQINLCKQHWLNEQEVPAQHFWNLGFPETHRWLCHPCYQTQQVQWIIWQAKEKQAIARYLTAWEKRDRQLLKKN